MSNKKRFKIAHLLLTTFFLILLWIVNSSLVKAAPVIDYSAPEEAKIEEELNIIITLSELDGNSQYRIKIRIGHHENLDMGQTLNHGTDRWVGATEDWGEFPDITSSANGLWSGVIKARLTTPNIPDLYNIVVAIKNENGTVVYESSMSEIMFIGFADDGGDDDDDEGGKGAVGEDEDLPSLPVTGYNENNLPSLLVISFVSISLGIYFLIKAIKFV